MQLILLSFAILIVFEFGDIAASNFNSHKASDFATGDNNDHDNSYSLPIHADAYQERNLTGETSTGIDKISLNQVDSSKVDSVKEAFDPDSIKINSIQKPDEFKLNPDLATKHLNEYSIRNELQTKQKENNIDFDEKLVPVKEELSVESFTNYIDDKHDVQPYPISVDDESEHHKKPDESEYLNEYSIKNELQVKQKESKIDFDKKSIPAEEELSVESFTNYANDQYDAQPYPISVDDESEHQNKPDESEYSLPTSRSESETNLRDDNSFLDGRGDSDVKDLITADFPIQQSMSILNTMPTIPVLQSINHSEQIEPPAETQATKGLVYESQDEVTTGVGFYDKKLSKSDDSDKCPTRFEMCELERVSDVASDGPSREIASQATEETNPMVIDRHQTTLHESLQTLPEHETANGTEFKKYPQQTIKEVDRSERKMDDLNPVQSAEDKHLLRSREIASHMVTDGHQTTQYQSLQTLSEHETEEGTRHKRYPMQQTTHEKVERSKRKMDGLNPVEIAENEQLIRAAQIKDTEVDKILSIVSKIGQMDVVKASGTSKKRLSTEKAFNVTEFLRIVMTDRNTQAYIFNVLILYVPVFICDVLLWMVITKLILHIRRHGASRQSASAVNLNPADGGGLQTGGPKMETETKKCRSRKLSCKATDAAKDSDEEYRDSNTEFVTAVAEEKIWFPPN